MLKTIINKSSFNFCNNLIQMIVSLPVGIKEMKILKYIIKHSNIQSCFDEEKENSTSKIVRYVLGGSDEKIASKILYYITLKMLKK